MVSPNSNKSAARPLDGSTLATGTQVFVFAQTSGISPRYVDFYVDGRWWRRDSSAPYDLVSSRSGLNTSDLGAGTHSVLVRATTTTTS
jgi:hypothetical protein